MRFFTLIKIIFILSFCFLFSFKAQSKEALLQHKEKYQAIVLGEITESTVKKKETYYITEYKLKIKDWLFKRPLIQETNLITIRVLGADIPEKGIVIKASTTPDYIPLKRNAIFLLENLRKKEKNIFTITQNGILPASKLKELKKEI